MVKRKSPKAGVEQDKEIFLSTVTTMAGDHYISMLNTYFPILDMP